MQAARNCNSTCIRFHSPQTERKSFIFSNGNSSRNVMTSFVWFIDAALILTFGHSTDENICISRNTSLMWFKVICCERCRFTAVSVRFWTFFARSFMRLEELQRNADIDFRAFKSRFARRLQSRRRRLLCFQQSCIRMRSVFSSDLHKRALFLCLRSSSRFWGMRQMFVNLLHWGPIQFWLKDYSIIGFAFLIRLKFLIKHPWYRA